MRRFCPSHFCGDGSAGRGLHSPSNLVPIAALTTAHLGYWASGPAYVEIEVDGVPEYTCKVCKVVQVIELSACPTCGAPLAAGDPFCGRCGTPRQATCASSDADLEDEDGLCGKYGARVT